MELSPADFDNQFRQTTGNPPYPWQRRLFNQFISGEICDALDIPTGLGKTSVISIWLLAHLLGEADRRPPMRLVYVVNRRTIVDQATRIAEACREQLSEHPLFADARRRLLGDQPLYLSTLRGALADNGEWMKAPHRPAIVIGTVDMIGSRLLFGAYRAGRSTKALHAGLLGQDALIVHDEAHLSRPFQELLEWIKKQQSHDGKQAPNRPTRKGSPRPLRVLAMSATGDTSGHVVLRLDQNDEMLESVHKRLHATKRLYLHEPDTKGDIAERLAALAVADEAASGTAVDAAVDRRVIIFVRLPKIAKAVMEILLGRYQIDASRVELLTGTIRGQERDALVTTPTLRRLLNVPGEVLGGSVFLVSTSAGEVGADFDADHLVCDATTLDSMIQRLGWVNRRGGSNSRVDMVMDIAPTDTKTHNAQRMRNTLAWLKQLPASPIDPLAKDASPVALTALRNANMAAYEEAISPPPEIVTPHPVTLDAWAMTSLSDWDLSLPIDEFLHGKSEYEPPQTTIAWRDEVALFFPPPPPETNQTDFEPDERKKQFQDWLDACPLRPRETLSQKSDTVVEWLAKVEQRRQGGDMLIRLHGRDVVIERIASFIARFNEEAAAKRDRAFLQSIGDDVFILPTVFGGCDRKGMLDANVDVPATDVAGRAHGPLNADAETLCVWLTREDTGWMAHALGQHRAGWDASVPGDAEKLGAAWANVNDYVRKRPGQVLQLWRRFTLRRAAAAEESVAGMLMLFRPPPTESGKAEKVALEKHNGDVGKFAQQFANALNLDEPTVQAIALAGRNHDLGKDRCLWQQSVFNDASPPLAKSFGRGMNPAILRHYRHEFGSLVDVIRKPDFSSLDAIGQDLALHLIGAHHGRGRPLFPAGAFDPDDETKPLNRRIAPAEIARRYARLQRRFGHWGLAWLESLVRCADHAASRGESPEDE